MNTTTIVMIVIAALVILVVGGRLAIVFARRQHSKNLHQQFGPEYDRMVNELGDKDQAELALEERIEHVKKLELHPLTEEQKNQFAQAWRRTQAIFCRPAL